MEMVCLISAVFRPVVLNQGQFCPLGYLAMSGGIFLLLQLGVSSGI